MFSIKVGCEVKRVNRPRSVQSVELRGQIGCAGHTRAGPAASGGEGWTLALGGYAGARGK